MSAVIYQLPIVPRPVSLLSDERYRLGVTHCLAVFLRDRDGWPREAAIAEAKRRVATMAPDGMPVNYGEGEV